VGLIDLAEQRLVGVDEEAVPGSDDGQTVGSVVRQSKFVDPKA
jgi:hypothetical protein